MSSSRLWSAGALVAVVSSLALLGGCGSIGATRLPIAAAGRTVTVTPDQSGKQVDLGLDQELVVRLPTEPTRGFRWQRDLSSAINNDASVLVADGPPGFEREALDSNPFGAAGFDLYRFKPRAAGQQTLRFESHRVGVIDAAPPEVAWFLVTVR